MTEWFAETLHPHVRQTYAVDEVIYRGRSRFQEILVFRNPTFGRVLALDGTVQTTEADEFVYHEMMAHVPLVAHPAPRRVLIIGGGDGGLLEEVLKHPVERVTMVEIDGEVIEAARRFLPAICGGAFDDPRARVVIGDGLAHVRETGERYDVILVDSTDPEGPGLVLFTEAFYADCRRCLNPGGILVTQNGVPLLQGPALASSVGHFRRLFADGRCYAIAVPTYDLGLMALGWASDDAEAWRRPLSQVRERAGTLGLDTRYWNPELHLGAFAIPTYMRKLIEA